MKKLSFLFLTLAVLMLLTVPAVAMAGTFETFHREDWFGLAALVVPVASMLANKTKTDVDNRAVGWFSKLVNFLALNFKRSGIK